MDPLAPEFAWTFKDDDWVRDALEAYKSFESLNEDGVHFSPRFSFQEPIDPWDSLTFNASASLEPSPMECVDSSASILSPELHVSEYKVEKSGHKRKVKDDGPDIHNPMAKRGGSSVNKIKDDTQSTNNMYGQNHFTSPASNGESLRQSFPYFETDSDVTAYTTFTESWEFEEAGPFGFEGETLIKLDGMDLTYADIDVGNFGDSFTLGQIPIQITYKSIYEITFAECQVEEKESAANCANFLSACDDNNSEIMGFDVHSDAMDQTPCHYMEHLVPSTDGNLAAGSSASIMELISGLDEFFSSDIEEIDTTYISNSDSFFLDFYWEESITNTECSSIPGGGASSKDDVNYGQFMNCSSEFAILRSTAAAYPELPPYISDIGKFQSAPAANNPELYIAFPPKAQILPSKPDAHPELCNEVFGCVLNTQDTEVPCNDDADFTLSSSSRRPFSLRHDYQLRGIKAYYLHLEEKSDSSETIPSKKAVYKAEKPDSFETRPSKKAMYKAEEPDSFETVPSKKAVYKAENVEETPDSSGTIQSNILSELGINLSFIKRSD